MSDLKVLKAAVHIDPSRIIAPVDPRIYSGFIEHLGRCIYGGILGDENPDQEKNNPLLSPSGFRKDVLHVIKDELQVPVMRWPGGNFVSSYRWKDGVGPKGLRPRRPELAWGGEESNQFGTDEFIVWCHEANVEPYICLNMGTGTLEDALDWVEYCNGTSETYWASKRRENGHPKPHRVKYWALGNEMWGPWQVGQLTATEYSSKAVQWARALKRLDPSITLISCGETGVSPWDYTVLRAVIRDVDLHSLHLYTSLGDRDRGDGWEYERSVFGPEAAEEGLEIVQRLIDLARIESGVGSTKDLKIAFDEWGSWDETKGTPQNGLEQRFTLTDALAIASWLNVFIRKADVVSMANYAQAVNVIAPIITNPSALFKQTIFHPLQLFATYMRGASSTQAVALSLHVESPSYVGVTLPTWISQIKKGGCQFIDVSAVMLLDEQDPVKHSIRVAVVNRHKDASFDVQIRLDGSLRLPPRVEAHEVYHIDLGACNSFEDPDNVRIVKSDESWEGVRRFKEHSFTLLVFDL